MKTAAQIAMEKDSGYVPNSLTREQMIACIESSMPPYKSMEIDCVKKNGRFVGGFVDQWGWYDLSSRTDAELQELYDAVWI